MLGKPKYTLGENVVFMCNGTQKSGRISIINAYGTFEQGDEVSYDIYSPEENMLYKHVIEMEDFCCGSR